MQQPILIGKQIPKGSVLLVGGVLGGDNGVGSGRHLAPSIKKEPARSIQILQALSRGEGKKTVGRQAPDRPLSPWVSMEDAPCQPVKFIGVITGAIGDFIHQ